MPAKHQPDFAFLRHVPLRRVHLFTLVQVTCLAVLWILKSTMAAIIFPVMVSISEKGIMRTHICLRCTHTEPLIFTLFVNIY